jgi:flagellar biosynthesis component FlhA
MLRTMGQVMLTVLFIYSTKLYVMQELLFWLAIVAVLCAFGAIVIAVVFWLLQMIRSRSQRIQTRSRGIFRTATARIAHGPHA